MAEKGTLTFSPIPAHAFGDAPFAIRAASSAPGTVTYFVLGGPAMLSDNNMLTITGGGTIYLEAREAAPGDQKPLTAEISFPVSTPTSATLTFTRTPAVKARFSSDTPNYPFLDSDGKFFLQNADSQYDKVPANHVWDFYSGTNEQAKNLALSKANSQFDTQALCEQGSPVYKALYDVKGVTLGEKGYADGNFCDLVGVWGRSGYRGLVWRCSQ